MNNYKIIIAGDAIKDFEEICEFYNKNPEETVILGLHFLNLFMEQKLKGGAILTESPDGFLKEISIKVGKNKG